MKKRKNKKQEKNIMLTILVSIFIILLLLILIVAVSTKDEVYNELENEGYYTETDDAFYKKVLTNNTLNEFYNDMNSGRNAKYQEVYVSKDSYEYIELLMIYNEGVTTTLTISSSLKSNELNYNFELSYNKQYLLLEGTEENNYDCVVTVNRNVKKDTEKKYCNLIKEQINDFLGSKTQLLNNQNLMNQIAGE
ncbi:MAG: hypothetical protein IJ463_05750 [Bacilli bacterium]|nr:hypothetical protein [Bacilli bacterium]